MTFANSNWLWGLLIIPILLLLFLRTENQRKKVFGLLVGSRLKERLLPNTSNLRRYAKFILTLTGLAITIIALARPLGGFIEEETTLSGRNVLLAFDVSKSMLANDITPNRLVRSKLLGEDIVNQLRGDRIGVIAFAGTAFLQAPLTIDHGAVLNTIRSLDTDTIPYGGSNFENVLKIALEAFGKSEESSRVLLFFSDGEELAGDIAAAAKRAKEVKVRIFTIGTGTTGGSLIPISASYGGTEFVRNKKGEPVRTHLDETRLQEIANLTGGAYFNLQDTPNLSQILHQLLNQVETADQNTIHTRKAVERYQWPLGIGLLLILSGFFLRETRFSKTVLMLFLFGLSTFSVHAADPYKLYEQGHYKEAFEALAKLRTKNVRDYFNEGISAYKNKDYDEAIRAFSEADVRSDDSRTKAAAAYNIGNSIAKKGESETDISKKITTLEDALKSYDRTLAVEPEHKQAKANKEALKKYIEELKKEQEKKRQEEQKQEKNKQDQQKQDEKDQGQNDPQKSEQNSKGNSSDKQKGEDKQGEQNQQEDHSRQSSDQKEQNNQNSNSDQNASQNEQGDSKEKDSAQPESSQGENRSQDHPSAPDTVDRQEPKDLSGQLQSKETDNKEQKSHEGISEDKAEEAVEEGKMNKTQARALLRSIEKEEDNVPLLQPQPTHPPDKDW